MFTKLRASAKLCRFCPRWLCIPDTPRADAPRTAIPASERGLPYSQMTWSYIERPQHAASVCIYWKQHINLATTSAAFRREVAQTTHFSVVLCFLLRWDHVAACYLWDDDTHTDTYSRRHTRSFRNTNYVRFSLLDAIWGCDTGSHLGPASLPHETRLLLI